MQKSSFQCYKYTMTYVQLENITGETQMIQILCTKDAKMLLEGESWLMAFAMTQWHGFLPPNTKMMFYCHHYCMEVRRICSNFTPWQLTRCSQMFHILCPKDAKSDQKEEADWWHLRWLSDMVFSPPLQQWCYMYCHNYCCMGVRRICSNFTPWQLTRCSQMFHILCPKDAKSDQKEEADWWHLRWLSDMVFSPPLQQWCYMYCHNYCCMGVRRICSNFTPWQDVHKWSKFYVQKTLNLIRRRKLINGIWDDSVTWFSPSKYENDVLLSSLL